MAEEKTSPQESFKHSASQEKVTVAPAQPKLAGDRPHVVVFKDVTKQFGEGANARVAIENVSFTVEDLPDIGELIVVVGPSGCGKSTLLRTIAALRPRSEEHTSELQSQSNLVCRLLLEKKKNNTL